MADISTLKGGVESERKNEKKTFKHFLKMKINSIRWRNIGSFGNKIQTLDFSNDGEVWQLYGRVGHGKSTILSLPTLAFYGKMTK